MRRSRCPSGRPRRWCRDLHPEAKAKSEDKTKSEPLDPNVREAQERLQRALGLKVRIHDKNGRGQVIIEYARLEDFDALLEAIAG